MGCEKEAGATEAAPPAEKKKLKICCACPETKAARDACVIEKGTSVVCMDVDTREPRIGWLRSTVSVLRERDARVYVWRMNTAAGRRVRHV